MPLRPHGAGASKKGDDKMKKPRLTDADRLAIETALKSGKTVYCIAKELSRPVTTITREIRARAVESDKGAAYRVTNRCAFRMECQRRDICAHCLYDGKRLCKFCRQCNSHCPAFVEQRCGRLERPPFVCNGCAEERKCVLRKRYYLHAKAQESYETVLSESRTGANITEGELLLCDRTLRDLTDRGQSIHAAMVNNPDRFTFSLKTAYRYVNGGLLSTKRHNLPRACMVKPRRGKGVEHRVDKTCRVGRTWDDYLKFVEGNPGVRVVEMDTVEGARGGKALLTLIFNPFNFMLAFLVDAKTSECVLGVFSAILSALKGRYGEDGGREVFSRLFPVILTDNGTEFSNPARIEFDADGSRLTSVFYCNAYASYEIPHVERNHEFIRLVLPKGTAYTEPTPFDGLTQSGVSLMMSHVNSYVRRGLGNKTPYDLFAREYGEDVAALFGISRIAANDVTLKPSLLGIEVKVKESVSPAETAPAGK